MPGKHVRFNEENIFYSPAPATPSPSHSDCSLPSSSGPRTPPQKVYSPLPTGPVVIHPLLAFDPRIPPINYDVSFPPNTLSPNIRSSPSALPPHVLAEPATNPPMATLTLINDVLPWTLTVQANSSSYVAVIDVLDAVYRFLRLTVSKPEYKALPSQEAKDLVSVAFSKRCHRAPTAETYEDEKQKGVKRVDFLVGHHKFMGLSSTKRGPDVWVLNLS
ncbi:hypothetical protein BV22DRAFT_1021899 [Leucogyrophana mollusca]|uniref:Uncharacterized protein n=1 Tax=Leucogyrophana mollusca TaxID=85980 RepID=A0ACB8B490_9AGAM|nr:hypothetical protein BV22DRAFT_1021899 [Leucogyrophana mollusca]